MTTELKITIKNIPPKVLDAVWKEVQQMCKQKFDEFFEPSNIIEIDLNDCFFREGVFEGISRLMTEYVLANSIKIKGES